MERSQAVTEFSESELEEFVRSLHKSLPSSSPNFNQDMCAKTAAVKLARYFGESVDRIPLTEVEELEYQFIVEKEDTWKVTIQRSQAV